MTTNNFDIQLPQKTLFLLNKKARYKVMYGGRGSGKSVAMCISALCLAMHRKVRILCTRQIQKSIKLSIHKVLSDYINKLGLSDYFQVTEETIRCNNGSEFIFSGVKNNVEEIKSMEGIDVCIVEEAQNVSDESWEILIPTVRKEGSEFWIAFNPDSEEDPTYQRFVKNPPPDCITKKVNYNDNPFFPSVLKDEMEYCKRVDYDKYLHIWEGHPNVHTEALVFKNKYEVKEFDIPTRDKVDRFFIGVDWGFANDPTTMVLSFIKDKCLYICKEGYGIGVDLADIPRKIFANVPESADGWSIYCDSARPETISFLKLRRWEIPINGKVKQVGFNLKPCDKWKGSVEDGIDYLRSFEKIYIHPTCKHTIDEFRNYSYEVDKKTGEVLPKLIDSYNHCLVGNTLITTEKGKVKIKDVKIGDKVLTRKGYKKVLWSGVSDRDRDVYKVITNKGKYLIGTDNHKVYTQRGFVRIDNLEIGDKLEIERSIELCNEKLLQCLGKNGIDTQTQNEEAIECILREAKYICTKLCGKHTKEQEKKGMLYTTKTETLKTILLKIWKKLHQKSIVQKDTNIVLKELKGVKNILIRLENLLLNGIKAKKAESGIESIENDLILDALILVMENVYNVVMNTNEKQNIQNFVATNVNQNIDGKVEKITLQKNASCAEKIILQANIVNKDFAEYIVDVKHIGKAKKVYDLTIDEQHEFYANGILVHNCIDGLRYSLNGYITNHNLEWLKYV